MKAKEPLGAVLVKKEEMLVYYSEIIQPSFSSDSFTKIVSKIYRCCIK